MLDFSVEEKYKDVIFYESAVHWKTLVTDTILPENLILVFTEDKIAGVMQDRLSDAAGGQTLVQVACRGAGVSIHGAVGSMAEVALPPEGPSILSCSAS